MKHNKEFGIIIRRVRMEETEEDEVADVLGNVTLTPHQFNSRCNIENYHRQ